MDWLSLVANVCFAVWLLLMGATQAFNIKFANRDKVMGYLALIVGAIYLFNLLRALAGGLKGPYGP
jgi:hypothetical protein